MEMNIILIVSSVVGVLGLLLGFMRLYKKATKTLAFVRTGLGGEKVVMNGGSLVFPVLHSSLSVNMETLRLTVERTKDSALITKDKLRADVLVEFYLKVKEDKESISRAAQTLGDKTLDTGALKVLVEGKFVDALRSSAAKMNMMELHEDRSIFVQTVQDALTEDLLKNGLELESVSLTAFDQTDKAYFNPENAFDAEGLKKLTEQIQERKKEINKIEQDTKIAIQKRDLTATKDSLTMEKEEKDAKLEQAKQIAQKTAEQNKEIREYEIEKEKEIEEKQIEKNRVIEEKQIEKDRIIEEKQIEKTAAIRTASENRKIEVLKAEKAVETEKIEKETAVKTAEQNKEIEISNKEKEEFNAKAEANAAKAEEIKSEEAIATASAIEIANREKELSLIKANENAETEAIEVKVTAEANKVAAADNAEAIKIAAQAEADAITIKAAAKAKDYEVEAKGIESTNEAKNKMSKEQIELSVKEQLIERLPEIIAQTVKPMEKIESIKIVDMNGGIPGGNGVSDNENVSLPDQVVNASLKNRISAPLVDELVAGIGIDISNPTTLLSSKSVLDTSEKEVS